MEKDFKNLDQLFKEKLQNIEEETSSSLNRKLYWKLDRKRYFLSGSAILLLLAAILYFSLPQSGEQKVEDDEKNIRKTALTNSIEPITSIETAKLNQIPKIDKQIKSLKSTQKSFILSKQKPGIKNINTQKTGFFLNEDGNDITKLEFLNFKLTGNNSKINIPERPITSVSIDYSKDEAKLSRWSLSLEYGQFTTWRTDAINESISDTGYWKVTENNKKLSPVFGFRLNYNFGNWVISSGLELSKLKQHYQYNISETMLDKENSYYDVDTIMTYIYEGPGQRIPVILGYDINYIELYKYEFYYTSYTNHYNYLEIPLMIGNKQRLGRFSLQAGVGLTFGFLTKAIAFFPENYSNKFMKINKENDHFDDYSSRFMTELLFGFNINRRSELYLKGFYKKELKSIYKDDPFNGTLHHAGFKLGINYCF